MTDGTTLLNPPASTLVSDDDSGFVSFDRGPGHSPGPSASPNSTGLIGARVRSPATAHLADDSARSPSLRPVPVCHHVNEVGQRTPSRHLFGPRSSLKTRAAQEAFIPPPQLLGFLTVGGSVTKKRGTRQRRQTGRRNPRRGHGRARSQHCADAEDSGGVLGPASGATGPTCPLLIRLRLPRRPPEAVKRPRPAAALKVSEVSLLTRGRIKQVSFLGSN